MKRIENQDYYQILEVPYKASWGEIQKAYELAKLTYNKGALATYSLFDFNERGRILDKIEEAYHVLSHPEKRAKYDRALETFISGTSPTPSQRDASPPPGPVTPSPVPAFPKTPPPPPAVSVPTSIPVPIPAVIMKTSTTGHEDMAAVAAEKDVVSGRTLKTLREKQGVTLEDIADTTRINISYLQFIESNSYGSLPAPVYIISYLKQYAKMLGIDSAIVEGYMKSYQRWSDSPRKTERYR